MSLQKQLEYNNGLLMYSVLNNEAPEYISNLYRHTPSRYSNSRNYHLIAKDTHIQKPVYPSLVLIYGTTYP